MDISPENINNYCRICMIQLKSSKVNIIVRSNQSDWLSVLNFLEINDKLEDGLPNFLCRYCYKKVKKIHELKKICIRSTKKYYLILKQCKQSNFENDNKTECNFENIKTEEIVLEEKHISENNQDNIKHEDIINENFEVNATTFIEPEKFYLSSVELKFEENNDQQFTNGFEDTINCSTKLNSTKVEGDLPPDEVEIKILEKRSQKRRKKRKSVSESSEEEYNDKDLLDSSENDKPKVLSENYNCEVCGKLYLTKRKYVACIRKHQGLKPYPCSSCEEEYSNFAKLKHHIKVNHSSNYRSYSCPMKKCRTYCKTLIAIENHCLKIHQTNYHSIKTAQELEDKNIEQHTEDNKDDSKETKEEISDNDEALTEADDKICGFCNKIHKNQKFQEKCIKKHLEPKIYTCQICGKALSSSWTLKKHMICLHNTEDSNFTKKCPFDGCEKIFDNKIKLENHYKAHFHKEKYSNKLYICPECGRGFNRNLILNRHMYTHTGNFPFKCNVENCTSKGFPSRISFERHQLFHKKIRNYACDICESKFFTNYELQKHKERLHTKAEDRIKYGCSFCEFKTFDKRQVKRHEKVVHYGIRKYKCQYCDLSFGKNQQLKNHTMTHTGERPLQCTLCPKRFIQLCALKAHLKAHARGTAKSDKNK